MLLRFPAIGRVLLAVTVLVGVIGWEEFALRKERSAEISQIIAELRKWTRDAPTRADLQAELEARMDRLNAPALLVAALPPDLFDNYLGSRALAQWAGQDRLAALEWVSRHPNAPERWLVLVLDRWIIDAPAAAEKYARHLPAGPWKTRIIDLLAKTAIQNGFPQRAISLIENIPPSQTSETLLRFAVGEWARRDEESLRHWIESRPDEHERSEFFSEMKHALERRSDEE